ncbi:MAG: M23 family metallopeptidase [Deltaproteobacteria bacterium]|nr:M23 family metallopeptidase [Deltaproteobacteria bacterium]MCW5803436.1 M23 family metallopeptidase [Deltaproteobacteria bacterium]
MDAMLCRRWVTLAITLALGGACETPPPIPQYPRADTVTTGDASTPVPAADPPQLGRLDDRIVGFAFDGGQLELELYRNGNRITQVARNRYMVPLMVSWTIGSFQNVEPTSPTSGVAFLPAASAPQGFGASVILATLDVVDATQRYRRELSFQARFGDPRVEARPYPYGLPYPAGSTFSVLQGFGGAFSHTGSNEFAIDFDCPVATPVLATRPGVVVAANASARGSGTTPDFLDYKKANFVLIRHDDGTIGEYMHLSPSGIQVRPGQQVARGQGLALSGNTGFSSTPHLHFQVMTAADDGQSARSFPFELAVAPQRIERPVQGRRYQAWESPQRHFGSDK